MKNRFLKFEFNSCLTFFWIILAIGLHLRFSHHFSGRSLWEDEAHLAINFINRGYLDLMKPLDNHQSAPILFLWAVETFTNIFGYSEVVLRTFIFLLSVVALPLFYFVVLGLTKNKITSLIAFLIYSINSSLVYYSSELKPYGVDVAICIILLYLCFYLSNQKLKFYLNLLFYAISPFLSNISFIIVITIFLFEILDHKQSIKNYLYDNYLKFTVFTISLICNYYLFIHNHPYGESMKQIWSFTFVPQNVFSSDFWVFMNERIDDTFFTNLLLFSKKIFFSYAILILFFISIFMIIKNKLWGFLIVAVAPILIHLAVSSFKLYPFHLRFILYITPLLMVMIAYGIFSVYNLLIERVDKSIVILIGVYVCFGLFENSISFAQEHRREFSPIISYINSNSPYKHVFVSAPKTLYDFYKKEGEIINQNDFFVNWQISSKDFFQATKGEQNSYYYIYSKVYLNTASKSMYNTLVKNELILNKFEYGSYGVLEIKPTFNTIIFGLSDCTGGNELDSITSVLWNNGTIETSEVDIDSGNYKVSVSSFGSAVDNIYPKIKVLIDNDSIGTFETKSTIEANSISFTVPERKTVKISLTFINDLSKGNEDRNFYFKNIQIEKQ